MDGDMWAARLLSKRQYAVHSFLDQNLAVDEIEGDEELRPDFACPYCFEGLDLLSLCSHLEDEHFSESRVALCPVCAAKVAKDMIGHITVHHGNLFKFQRRRKFRRSAVASHTHSGFPFNGKDINQAQLQALLGACSPVRTGSSSIPDMFLSTLVCNIPISESEDSTKLDVPDSISKPFAAPTELSVDTSLTAEEREQKLEEASVRSKFVRQLIFSTLWPEN